MAVTHAESLTTGIPLQQLLASARPLPWRPATAAIASVAQALMAIHDDGRVHGGVQPDTIVIADNSIELGAPGAKEDPRYLAPERIDEPERDVGPAEDVFALGVVWYQLLAGRLPWRLDSPHELLRTHMWVAPDPLPEFVDMPRRLNELCLECLAKEPWQRPDAAELVAALTTIGVDGLPEHGPIGVGRSDRRRSRWSLVVPWLVAGIATVVLCGAILRQAGAGKDLESAKPRGDSSTGAATSATTPGPSAVPTDPAASGRPVGSVPTPGSDPSLGPSPTGAPSITGSPSPRPSWTAVTVAGIGGKTRIECTGTDLRLARIKSATPASGYQVTILDAGPAHQVRVRFQSKDSRTDINAVCNNGIVAPRVVET